MKFLLRKSEQNFFFFFHFRGLFQYPKEPEKNAWLGPCPREQYLKPWLVSLQKKKKGLQIKTHASYTKRNEPVMMGKNWKRTICCWNKDKQESTQARCKTDMRKATVELPLVLRRLTETPYPSAVPVQKRDSRAVSGPSWYRRAQPLF